ncbi:MAG: hypothetical protein UFG06_05890 [Lachnospiraceae bacterium]|nr:hypothetical protein [Lachnospiraceae bacterium]
MNNENYWEQFMASGKVGDYLNYVGGMEASLSTEASEGEYPYAGFYYGDGNGVKPGSRG